MERLTERHCGVAVVKDKSKLKEAMEKLAAYEEAGEKNIKTNGDVIRSMSDEQLAFLFASITIILLSSIAFFLISTSFLPLIFSYTSSLKESNCRYISNLPLN